MTTRARKQPLAFVFTLVLAILALSATPALAARGHVFSKTFAGACVAEPCEGLLKEPSGVAVSEATGDLYVVDKGEAGQHGRVARFSAAGGYLGEFNGSGTVEVGGVKIEGKAAGSGAGEVETGRFVEPEVVAVDNSCSLRKLTKETTPSCEAFDPSNGDVYVVDHGNKVIDKFSASGEYISQISEDGEGRFSRSIAGVAVDPQGAAWIFLENGSGANAIDRYSNQQVNKFVLPQILIQGLEPLEHPLAGFAVDAEGSFYVRASLGEDFTGRIAKIGPEGNTSVQEVDHEKSTAVAVDQKTGDSFIGNINSIGAFDASGGELERLSGKLTAGVGIGVDARSGFLYAADSASDEINVFAPVPPSTPGIESESVAEITAESASLGAEINPRSEPTEGVTEYSFRYGACSSPGDCSSSGYETTVPIAAGKIAPDFEVHAVSVPVQGLKPGTAYHFKVVAHNSLGPIEGAEKSFTTQSASGVLVLPDNRGWELVSPPDKQGASIEPITEAGVIQAAADGSAITYLANAPVEAHPQGAANKSQVLSSRQVGDGGAGTASWSSRDISIPHSNAVGSSNGAGPEYKLFDEDLSSSAVQPFGEFVPQLSEEASESTAYLHSLSPSCGASCYRPLVTAKPGFANVWEGTEFGEEARCKPEAGTITREFCGPEVLGASTDLKHLLLRSTAALKAGAGARQLYEWSGGQLVQVSVLPQKESAPEVPLARFGFRDQAARNAISTDGARVVWGSEPNLYLRDLTGGETVQLDKTEAGCGEHCTAGGNGRFQSASADDSRILFTDTERLTRDSGAEPAGTNPQADLYECQIVPDEGKLTCDLSDLTPANGGEGAAVQGGILGSSADGSIVYFVADGVLSEAPNDRGQKAMAKAPNLYVRDGASTSFIATLAGRDEHDWSETLSRQPTRVSPNGQWLELMSQRLLTGYDNRDAATGKPAAEVYLYNAGAAHLSCASCEPTGGRPVGVEYRKLEPGSGGLVGGPRGLWPAGDLVAANVPGWTAIATGGQEKERYQPRYLNDSGRLFFNTADGLVPQDSNGTQDVYEYEPPGVGGVGGCTGASPSFSESSGGCVNLISSGASAQESAFLDASESGDDVFFLTAARLSSLDTDTSFDVYDAHVCSAAQPCIVPPGAPPAPCASETSCGGPPAQPSIFGSPPTSTFTGPGNLAAAAGKTVVKAKSLTRAQKLAKALKACHARKKRKRRASCEKASLKKYGPLKKTKRQKK